MAQSTAKVLSEHCQQQFDIATHQSETRCNAAVQFTTTAGQVISTSVGDAFPTEFHGSGNSKTIDLRYDTDDPTAPYKQSNYMSLPTFLALLVAGCLLLLWGCWMAIRADRTAQRYRERLERIQARTRR